MKSRLAIIALLATGALMSTSGAALGISALSTDLTASSAQYGTPAAPTAGAGDVLAGGGAGGPQDDGAGAGGPQDDGAGAGRGGVAGAQESGGVAGAQAPRQIAASQGGELPFTGYAAIPLLLVGLLLLGSGLVLRRGTRGTPMPS